MEAEPGRMGDEPGLTVVAASRNDEHGGHLLARMQVFVNGLAEQSERFGFPLELIVVEWNPPADRALLVEALRWPVSAMFQPRIITVPREVHSSFSNANLLPLYQMIAKNVGIRRARAPFVLATNIDILLSDDLFELICAGLKPKALYRVDRRDVVAPLQRDPLPSPAECRALPALRRHGIDGTTPKPSPTTRRLQDLPQLVGAILDRVALPRLHTSGCGDFTLTSREVWASLRGYPEWPIFSWQLDGLPLYQAFAGGVQMINLADPMVAIHLEHSLGSGWTPEGSSALFDRLRRAGIPYLSTREYRAIARKLVRGRGFQPFNGDDWGLASQELEATYPQHSAGGRY